MRALASILKRLMKEKNLSESELARQTGVGQPVIHRISSGETDNPKIESLRPLAKFFSLSISQLVGDEPLFQRNTQQKKLIERAHILPFLTFEQTLLWRKNKDQIHVLNDIITEADVSTDAYAVRVEDTTMRPRFPEGTVLIVDPHYPIKDGSFVIAYLKEQEKVVFKQLLIDGEHQYLKSLNVDFPIIRMPKEYLLLGTMVQALLN